MKKVSEVVDIELSEEETITLLKARVICKELAVELNKISTKRKVDQCHWAQEASDEIGEVMCMFGAYIDEDENSDYRKLSEKLQYLLDEE